MPTEISGVKVHYDMIRNNEKEILYKLDRELAFYRIYFNRKVNGKEIIYDTPNNLLSGVGLVLSKQFEDGKVFFKVRKLSYLPTELRKPSQKFYLAECNGNESPKDYPLQISTAINNAFSNIFTIDLVEVVKQTIPKYEIKIKGNLYELTSGTGMRGTLVFEKVTYKDLVSGKKVKRRGATVTLPNDPAFKKDSDEVLAAIETRCKELLLYKESRFEIAQRLLKPKDPNHKFDRKAFKESLKNKDKESEETKKDE